MDVYIQKELEENEDEELLDNWENAFMQGYNET